MEKKLFILSLRVVKLYRYSSLSLALQKKAILRMFFTFICESTDKHISSIVPDIFDVIMVCALLNILPLKFSPTKI